MSVENEYIEYCFHHEKIEFISSSHRVIVYSRFNAKSGKWRYRLTISSLVRIWKICHWLFLVKHVNLRLGSWGANIKWFSFRKNGQYCIQECNTKYSRFDRNYQGKLWNKNFFKLFTNNLFVLISFHWWWFFW